MSTPYMPLAMCIATGAVPQWYMNAPGTRATKPRGGLEPRVDWRRIGHRADRCLAVRNVGGRRGLGTSRRGGGGDARGPRWGWRGSTGQGEPSASAGMSRRMLEDTRSRH